MKKLRIMLLSAALVSGAAWAGAQEPTQPEARNASPARAPQMMMPAPPASTANVHIEVSIADSVGSTPQQKKSVSMLVAEGFMGRVRSQRGQAAILNIDATPRLQQDGRISLQLILEYRPRETAETLDLSPMNEMLTVLLQSGKPLVVTQAADPSSDRKVVVQVTATILK
jgi:glucose/arabinose dehydrogenase